MDKFWEKLISWALGVLAIWGILKIVFPAATTIKTVMEQEDKNTENDASFKDIISRLKDLEGDIKMLKEFKEDSTEDHKEVVERLDDLIQTLMGYFIPKNK